MVTVESRAVPSRALLLSDATFTSPLPGRPGRRSEGGGHASALVEGLLFAGLTAHCTLLQRGTTNLCVCVFLDSLPPHRRAFLLQLLQRWRSAP